MTNENVRSEIDALRGLINQLENKLDDGNLDLSTEASAIQCQCGDLLMTVAELYTARHHRKGE